MYMKNLKRAGIVRNELKRMKSFTKQEKYCIISNYWMHYLTEVKGYDFNDELIKQLGILSGCIDSERPVPKQLVPLNELTEPLETKTNSLTKILLT